MKTPKFRISILIAFVLMLFTLNGFAQDSTKKHSPEAKAKKITEKMKTALNLTDDQYSQMYDLTLKQIKWKKDNKDVKMTKADRKTKREEFKAEVKKILNDEQMAKLQKIKKKHHKSLFRKIIGLGLF